MGNELLEGLTRAQVEALRYFARTDGPVQVGRLWKSVRVLRERGLVAVSYQYSPFGSYDVAEVTRAGLLALKKGDSDGK